MLLYGDSPPAGEPTLELLRRPLAMDAPVEAAREILERTLPRWGWDDAVGPASWCAATVIAALGPAAPEALELFAYRRAHQLTVELHCTHLVIPFHRLLGEDERLASIDTAVELWGIRPLGDGDAVWFEFRSVVP